MFALQYCSCCVPATAVALLLLLLLSSRNRSCDCVVYDASSIKLTSSFAALRAVAAEGIVPA